MNKRPIFLLGAHKSGTSLLRSLFDGHSQLFALPLETHFFENMHYWVDYEYRRQRPASLNRDEIIESFCKWIHHSNSSSDKYADSVAEGIFDEAKFRNHFSTIKTDDNDTNRMGIYFEAIYNAVYGHVPLPTIRMVEKSIEHAEFAMNIQVLFPEAKFIHIIRNPYANIVALRRFKCFSDGFPLMPRILDSLYNSYYYLYKNSRFLKNYYVIRYEDLVTNPKKSLEHICQFLDIPFEDKLLVPTYLGKAWGGNSTTGKVFTGIDASNLDKWRTTIYPFEIFYVNKLFPFIFTDYNYESVTGHGSSWKRAKGENLVRYLYNRLYRFYI
ncbi:sulfotransferase [candidate division KSB1 bacterium]|nr:sulfotransferase [candidate division KSB1 bacterium]